MKRKAPGIAALALGAAFALGAPEAQATIFIEMKFECQSPFVISNTLWQECGAIQTQAWVMGAPHMPPFDVVGGSFGVPAGKVMWVYSDRTFVIDSFDIEATEPVKFVTQGVEYLVAPDGVPGFQHVDGIPANLTRGVHYAQFYAPAGSGFRIDNIRLTAVPEPRAWTLAIAGFGFVGAVLRHRSRSPSTS